MLFGRVILKRGVRVKELKHLQHVALDRHVGKNSQLHSIQLVVQCIFRRHSPLENL